MTDYLSTYGAGDAKREKIVKRTALAILLILVLGVTGYFTLRNYSEKAQIRAFLANLKNKDYKKAYEQWGCTAEHPCRDYSYEKFMEDWGPQSIHSDPEGAKVESTKSCDSGIIEKVNFSKDQVLLWVGRRDKSIGFAPWPVCQPHIQMGS